MRGIIYYFQLSWAEFVHLSVHSSFPLLSSVVFSAGQKRLWLSLVQMLFSPSWRTTCLWAFSFSSATCKLSMCLIVVLRSPGLKMAWVLPLAGVFFCTQASGLVCTGRLLQNMLGIGCEFKGKELFCTRFLPQTLVFCRKVGQYFSCVIK